MRNRQNGALIRRFFVSASLLWLCPATLLPAASPPEPDCKINKFDEQVTVKKVIDGDTIIITDDRHIRLIGINTPEIGHDNSKSEMGANEALDYLSRLLRTNKQLHLLFDDQQSDHYGRTLAHLFLHDGTNIQSLLLKRGLATPLTIPPNLDFVDCYQASADYARKHGIGLWALIQYQTRPVESITINDRGYRIISGKVKNIGESESSLWINLTGNMALRVTKDDLQYFDKNLVHKLPGNELVARGWVYFMNGEFRMRIRHPADLKIINSDSTNRY